MEDGQQQMGDSSQHSASSSADASSSSLARMNRRASNENVPAVAEIEATTHHGFHADHKEEEEEEEEERRSTHQDCLMGALLPPINNYDDSHRAATTASVAALRSTTACEATNKLAGYAEELRRFDAAYGTDNPHPHRAGIYSNIGLLYQHMLQDHRTALAYHRALDTLLKCKQQQAAGTTNGSSNSSTCNSSVRPAPAPAPPPPAAAPAPPPPAAAAATTIDLRAIWLQLAVTLADIAAVQRTLGMSDRALTTYQLSLDAFAESGAPLHHPARSAAEAGAAILRMR